MPELADIDQGIVLPVTRRRCFGRLIFRMPDVLARVVEPFPLVAGGVLISLVLAMLLGGVVALVYRFPPHVIGDNVARAFRLVGALSIARFRTIVRVRQVASNPADDHVGLEPCEARHQVGPLPG